MPHIRYFAAAAEAAGTPAEELAGSTIAELRARMLVAHGAELERVVARCAILVAGVRSDDTTAVAPGDVVDVLPPFAGG